MKSKRIMLIPNRISVLHHVRRAVSILIRNNTEPKWEHRIVLAVDEALSNIIQHGYTYHVKDIIKLSISCSTTGFQFRIEDNANIFLGHDENSKTSGYGLSIIKSIMEVERLHVSKGNILILQKKFTDMS